MVSILLRTVAIAIWEGCLYGVLGGAFVLREDLSGGLYNRYTMTMYKTLPPVPRGPAYCDFLAVSDYALARPCDWKPPFIGWLQGGKY